MYTATKLSHADDKQTQRRIVTIKFEDLSIPHEFVKDFSFRLTDTVEVMKKAVGSYLAELNAVPEVLPDGAVDTTVTPDVPVETTPAELARTQWETDFAKLEKVKRLIDCGVLTGNETQIVTLRNKVKADFKPAYLG